MEDLQAQIDAAMKMAPALEAAEAGDAAAMAAALDKDGLAVDTAGEDGDTPLHIGCLYGKLEVVEECLRRSADVKARDEDNSTPLHDCCAGGHEALARLLLSRGADASAVDDDGDSPLHLATNGGHAHVVRLLLEHLSEDARKSLLSTTNALGQKPTDLAEDPALLRLMTISGGDDDEDEDGVGAAFKKVRK